jgi:hypothetical protein
MSIQIGTKYVIKNHPYAPNNGMTVTVTAYLGEMFQHCLGHRWRIDALLADTKQGRPLGRSINHVNQQYLFPIDKTFEAGLGWESLKDIFNPVAREELV